MLLNNFSVDQVHQGLSRRGINLSQGTVRQAVFLIKKEMRERRLAKMDSRIDLELAVLEKIREKAMGSYDRSLRDEVTIERTEEVGGLPGLPNGLPPTPGLAALQNLLGGANQAAVTKQVTKEKRRGQSGDPRFLDTALRASGDIRKMLGIDPEEVKRLEFTAIIANGLSPEQLRAMDPTELTRFVAEEIAKS